MSNKRARGEETQAPAAEPQAPGDNEFVSWLLRKIYTYAEVRDSEELQRLREELRIRTQAYDRLHDLLRTVHVRKPETVCYRCGNIDESLIHRPRCGLCVFYVVHCSQLPWCDGINICGSGKHRVCSECPMFVAERCTGSDDTRCTYGDDVE